MKTDSVREVADKLGQKLHDDSLEEIEDIPDTESKLFLEIKDTKKRSFLRAYTQCGDIGKSAKLIESSRSLIWKWRKEDDLFRIPLG